MIVTSKYARWRASGRGAGLLIAAAFAAMGLVPAGAWAAPMAGNDGSAGGAWRPAAVIMRSSSKLPQTGVTAAQCYGSGSNALVACGSAGAIGLSGVPKQDGMYADVNPETYARVGGYPLSSCVKDRITGLVWEGKTAIGARSGSALYTNFGTGGASDTSGYVRGVNARALCGYTDWRLPSASELETIVDAGNSGGSPAIDTVWFPNSGTNAYWSATPYADDSGSAWYVEFSEGNALTVARFYATSVRLVHGPRSLE